MDSFTYNFILKDFFSENMLMSMVLSVQLFLLILDISFAWDGCKNDHSRRCGDSCIWKTAICKCGDTTFGYNDQKWCCHNSTCTGKGEQNSGYGYWHGEWEGEKKVGAECTGRELNLTEACDRQCNYYEED